MERSKRKPGMKTAVVVLCLFLLIAGIMVFSAIRAAGVARSTSAKLLRDITTNALAYRVAEMEYILSFEKKDKDKYMNRMASELAQLERNQRKLEPLLATEQEKTAYAAFSARWKSYLKESNTMIALSKNNFHQQAITALTQISRGLFENSSGTLDMLVEANANSAKSWTGFVKVFFKENRIALALLYIYGMAAFFILIFSLYYKRKKKRL